jgi:hypothetical protein
MAVQAVEAAIAGGDLDGELAVAGVAGDEDDDGAVDFTSGQSELLNISRARCRIP